MKYKNIVFDVGGVLLSYNWQGMMVEHGMTNDEAEEFADTLFLDPLWAEFDLENWTYDEVAAKYVEKYPDLAESIRYFFFHKEKMPRARKKVYELARGLHDDGARLYILSNYSSVLFEEHTRIIDIMDIVDGRMVSSSIHICKPDERIYRALFEKCKIVPQESVFFDDRIENVEASKALGMDAVLVTSEEHLERELERLRQE